MGCATDARCIAMSAGWLDRDSLTKKPSNPPNRDCRSCRSTHNHRECSELRRLVCPLLWAQPMNSTSNPYSLHAFGEILQARYLEILESPRTLPFSKFSVAELMEISAALERITLDTFGLCETCDSRILHARLLRYPQTRYCFDCELEFEGNMGRRRYGDMRQ